MKNWFFRKKKKSWEINCRFRIFYLRIFNVPFYFNYFNYLLYFNIYNCFVNCNFEFIVEFEGISILNIISIKMTSINSMVDLKPFKTIWKINIKKIQPWKQYFSRFSRTCSVKKKGFCVCLVSYPINPWYINYSLVPQFLIKIDPVHRKEII